MNVQIQGWHISNDILCADCGQPAKFLVELEDSETGYFFSEKNLCELCIGTDRYTVLGDSVSDAWKRVFDRSNPMT